MLLSAHKSEYLDLNAVFPYSFRMNVCKAWPCRIFFFLGKKALDT